MVNKAGYQLGKSTQDELMSQCSPEIRKQIQLQLLLQQLKLSVVRQLLPPFQVWVL